MEDLFFDLILNEMQSIYAAKTESNRAKVDWSENGMIYLNLEINNARME